MVTGQVLLTEAMAPARTHEDALELAVREHAQLVYRIAFAALGNHHDAEDATQETFLRVLRYGKGLERIEDLRRWLARIAWRVATGRKKKVPEIPFSDASRPTLQLCSHEQPVDAGVIGQQLSGILEGLIASLPAKLRGPITLSTLEEMSVADVAAVLSISEAAVRSRLFRAREILKAKLAARLGGTHET